MLYEVITHHHALALGLLGEAVGVVVDAGGFADEQGVVFREPRVIAAVDQFDVDIQGLAGLDERVERLFIGGRQGIVRVVQDGSYNFV